MANDGHDIDRLIEHALSGERMVSVPRGFHARVHQRLRIVALERTERRGFARRIAAACVASVVAAASLAGLAVVADVPARLTSAMPGGLGFWDYLRDRAAVAWDPGAQSFGSSVVWLVVGAGAMLAALFWGLAGSGGRDVRSR